MYLTVSHSDAEVLHWNEAECTWDSFNEAMHENNGNLTISSYKTKSRKLNCESRETVWKINLGSYLKWMWSIAAIEEVLQPPANNEG